MKPIIKIENLSKQYRLGTIGTGTISNDLKRWWYRTRGKEDPFLKIGESNDRSVKGSSEYVWALKDINLEVMPGEVLGIIGKNGAGKSTLLKILSKVTGPTTGSISFNGRIGSLLEVGTGFHPELTGRENIFLNGAILGMTKAEIHHKLDEIIDFSGCERYIDTPVKRYSSGMTVRLGFAVAAHLEPEILVVDEVLAVGDAEFQKKAIGKMQDVSRNEGRTVLFVSHNMGAVKGLCEKAMILENGKQTAIGTANEVVEEYLRNKSKIQDEYIFHQSSRNEFAFIDSVAILNKGKKCKRIPLLDSFSIRIRVTVKKRLPHFIVGLGITTPDDISIHTSFSKPLDIETGTYEYHFQENVKHYSAGKYKIKVGLSSRENAVQYIDDYVYIEIDDHHDKEKVLRSNMGLILNPMDIEVQRL
jgi:lipopolysaccharide transport system ATP-binding protein